MYRASQTFSVLQAIAVTAGLAILLWSIGLPSLRFAEAASVSNYSDTLSTSEPSVGADHEITFTTPSGVANASTIVLDFSDGSFGQGSVTFADMDISTTTGFAYEFTLGAAGCSGGYQIGVDVSSWPTVTMTLCSGESGAVIPANGTTTILIGQNATGGAGNNQIVNSASTGSHKLPITAGADSGETIIAIVPVVTVSASVDTVFDFTVQGVNAGLTVNGTTTGTSTSATEIAFGKLTADVATTGAQDLIVTTNAKNGYTVSVVADGQLRSTNGADIDRFKDGANTPTPTAWTAPTATVGQENTYGHWGITSDDPDIFSAQQTYVSASTSPVDIMNNSGPAVATTTRVGYTVEISSLQEAANDYQAILTYIATPTF